MGVLFALGLPFLAFILMVTLVAGLLGLGLLLALLLIYSVAYAAGALSFGRLILKPPRPRFVAFLSGWAILRVAALIPVLGGLLVATAVWGLGAIVVAGFVADGARPPGPSSGVRVPMPPPPPIPALP